MDKKIPWPYDEFAGEVTAPEHEILFREIAGELAFKRREARTMDDLFLTDFSKAWQLNKDSDGRGFAGDLPQAVIDAHYRLHGPESNRTGQQKAVEPVVAGGVSISPTADGGLVLRQGSSGSITVPADQVTDFLNGCRQQAAKRPVNAPSPAANVASNRVLSQNEKVAFGNPVLEERKRQNDKEMEKYAKQSGMTYPKWQ